MSTETIPSPGRPNEITAPELINKIHDIVLNDSKVKVHDVAEIVSILTERVVNILHTHLCVFTTICGDGSNMDPLLYSRITCMVKIVG